MTGTTHPILLLGVGTAGSRIARGVRRAFGESMRCVLTDTDASSGLDGEEFVLLGGDRLSGRGAGGDPIAARLAAEDSLQALDPKIEGVRLAVIVTALGGGTGSGATLEIIKHLSNLGIATIVFATTPFLFEGEDRMRTSRGVMSLIEQEANSVFFLPLDKLVGSEDVMEVAMKRAVDTLASGVSLFWRLIQKPGYIRLDADRIRRLMIDSGRGRFAFVTVQGPDRASEAVDKLMNSELLAIASSPVNAILCGVLAGEDLRLSELGRIADGVRESFGEHVSFELGTVNDEKAFCGRICVVVMIFESIQKSEKLSGAGAGGNRRARGAKSASGLSAAVDRGRFSNAAPTIWHGEDLDVPTFIRRNINLDF
jgi:cell division protein FtsZ